MATRPSSPGHYRFRDGISAAAPFETVDVILDGDELVACFHGEGGEDAMVAVDDMDGEWQGPLST